MTPEVSKKLGDANLLYATGKFDEVLKLGDIVDRVALMNMGRREQVFPIESCVCLDRQ